MPFAASGMQSTPPAVKMENIRHTGLPATQSAVFDLQPGEISKVIADQSGFYIYKMLSKSTLPQDKVQDEIKNILQSQRRKDLMDAVQGSTTAVLSDAYFPKEQEDRPGAGLGPEHGHPPSTMLPRQPK